MLKKVLALLIALGGIIVYGQNEAAIIPVNFKSIFYDSKESLTVSNPENGDLLVLIEDELKTNYYLLDENFRILKSFEGNPIDKKFKNFIGYQIGYQTYSIFFTNNSKKKYGKIDIDFEELSSKSSFLEIDKRKEKYLTAVSINDRFYILTALKSQNDVNFHEYSEKTSSFDKKKVSFEDFEFTPVGGFKKYAYSYLKDIQKIDVRVPNPIEITSKKTKLYSEGKYLLFTNDSDKELTKVIELDVSNFEKKSYSFEKEKLDNISNAGDNYFLNSLDNNHPESNTDVLNNFSNNSYYYRGNLYQIVLNSKEMVLKIYDFKTKEVLKSIIQKKQDSITFKNGPIIQKDGGEMSLLNGRVRELEKTSKFLRKAHLGETGISAYKIGDKLQLRIGSYEELRGSPGMPMVGMPMGGLPIGAFGAISVTFNPMVAAYGSYSSSRSTYISCLFDKDYNHIAGDPIKTVFERIESYDKELENKYSKYLAENPQTDESDDDYGMEGVSIEEDLLQLENIFFHNGGHYFSYLNIQDKNYHLIKF